MDVNYQGITLSNYLEWSKHIAIMTNKAYSKLSFLRRNLRAAQRSLIKLLTFLCFALLQSMAPLFVTHTKSTTVLRLRGWSVELQCLSKVGIQDTLVFLICLMCRDGRLFLKGDRRLIIFYTIINGLAQVPFECVLFEAYKGTRRKYNMKFRQIGHTTSQYGLSFFHKNYQCMETWLLSLKLRHWLYVDQIFLTISVHPFRIIPQKGPAEYRNRNISTL